MGRGRIIVSGRRMLRQKRHIWAFEAPKRPSVALFISRAPSVTRRMRDVAEAEKRSVLHLIATQDAASATRGCDARIPSWQGWIRSAQCCAPFGRMHMERLRGHRKSYSIKGRSFNKGLLLLGPRTSESA